MRLTNKISRVKFDSDQVFTQEFDTLAEYKKVESNEGSYGRVYFVLMRLGIGYP